MEYLTKYFFSIRTRFSDKALKLKKAVYRRLRKKTNKKVILFIVGCQRSGTTLMTKLLEKNINTKIFGEFSELSSIDSQKIRLNPLHLVEDVIENSNYPIVVLKPLVESQNLIELLDYFKSSKALWMFRNYKDVASSHIKKWGINNGINNLRPIAMNYVNNWRNENLSEHTRQLVLNYFSEKMNPHDAAALFWYTRNILFFEQGLQKNYEVNLCKYEDLVFNPHIIIKAIYSFIGFNYQEDRSIAMIYSSSVDKGKSFSLSPEIERLCDGLYKKLDTIYYQQHINSKSIAKDL